MEWMLPALALALAAVVWTRHAGTATLREEWDLVLTPAGRRALDAVRQDSGLDAEMLRHSHDRAVAAREGTQVHEALRLLDGAFWVIQEATPSRLKRLRAMSVCSRMVAAIVPLPPLRLRSFSLRRLMTAAGAAELVRHFAATEAQRFRLRLFLLSWGFRFVLKTASRTSRFLHSAPSSGRGWDVFGKAASDFQRLDEEHVRAFRALLSSVAAAEGTPQVSLLHTL